MKPPRAVRISKLLSLVLRHKPEHMGLVLDASGWVTVASVLQGFLDGGLPVTRSEIEDIVRESDKQRFAFSADGQSIRASQGHTVAVDLGYAPAVPPPTLFHGTVDKFLDSIRAQGLVRGQRHHVHLSANTETAVQVGSRRGRPVILHVDAGAMVAAGHLFFISANGVWLTEQVPPPFILFRD